MSGIAMFSDPTTAFWCYQGGGSLYHSLPRHMPEAAKSYWLTCNSVYANTRLTWVSSYLSDRETALQLITAMESLNDNWDGFGGASIPKATLLMASSFVSSLPTHVPAPEVSANSNGTISLEWENDLGRAHLEIGKTKYSLYFRRYEGNSVFRDGLISEIDRTREGLLNEMFCLAAPQDYTISDIHLAKTA